MTRPVQRPPEPPSPVKRPPGADDTLEQPSDDKTDRAAPVDVGVGPAIDPVQRAERGARDVDAPRRGAPPGMAAPSE